MTQISILNNHYKKIGFINNKIDKMLHFKNDIRHVYLSNSTSTFDFTIPKWNNGKLNPDALLIDDSCFFLLKKRGRYDIYSIFDYSENDFEIIVQCNSMNSELSKEKVRNFNSTTAQTLRWYAEQMGLLSFTFVTFGINELSDKTMILSFDNEESKLDRLYNLVTRFGGEMDFETVINSDGSFETYKLNIYHANDETHQGVGKIRNDIILTYGKTIKGVQFNSNKDEQYTAFYATGKKPDGKVVDITNLELSIKNEDGIEEFYTRKGSPVVYAPIAAQRYPSALKDGYSDIWILEEEKDVEVVDENELLNYMLDSLKKHAYPAMTYTVDAYSTALNVNGGFEKGDTVRIHDRNFKDTLVLKARVVEYIESEDQPSNDQVVFSNYQRIKTTSSSAIYNKLVTELNNNQPYSISIASSNGTVFKNNQGTSIATATLNKGSSTINCTFKWFLNGSVVSQNNNITISGSGINDKSVYTVNAYVDNVSVASSQITFTNINDGLTITSVERFYLLTNDGSNVTVATVGWTNQQQVLTTDYMYLWIYDKQNYSNGTYTLTNPTIIAHN